MKTKVKGLCGEDITISTLLKIGRAKCSKATFYGIVWNKEKLCLKLCFGCKTIIGER